MEFTIYNDITEQTARELIPFLNENDEKTIRISSHGGDVFAGIAIYNLLKTKDNVTAQIDGLCASAATLVALGANHIKAASNTLIMLHLPSVFLLDNYNADDLTKVQNTLTAVKNTIVNIYLQRINKTATEIETMLKSETWLTAQEAKDLNLVDEITDELLIQNKGDIMNTNEQMLEKYKASVLQMERARLSLLTTAKTENPYVNALIDVAIAEGEQLSNVQKYIDAVKKVKVENHGIEKLTQMIEDNVKSGAVEVTNTPPVDNSEIIAKYMNSFLKK